MKKAEENIQNKNRRLPDILSDSLLALIKIPMIQTIGFYILLLLFNLRVPAQNFNFQCNTRFR